MHIDGAEERYGLFCGGIEVVVQHLELCKLVCNIDVFKCRIGLGFFCREAKCYGANGVWVRDACDGSVSLGDELVCENECTRVCAFTFEGGNAIREACGKGVLPGEYGGVACGVRFENRRVCNGGVKNGKTKMRGRDHVCVEKRLRNFQLLADFPELRCKCHLAGREFVAFVVARNLIAYENYHARNVAQTAARQHGDERYVRLGARFCWHKAC